MSSVVSKLLKDKTYDQLIAVGRSWADDEPSTGESPLFDQLAGMDGLRAGWTRVQQRSPAAGGDGISVAQWGFAADERLALLSADLMAGRYHPGPVRHFTVAKAHGGGTRALGIPCVADRVVQSAALILLGRLFEAAFEDSSFGCRPGRSVQAAAERIGQLYRQGYTHVIESDIQSYFDTVPHGPLIADLEQLLHEPPLLALFSRWLDMAGSSNTGLLQGAPISPLLANLYLDQLDEAVAAHGLRIVRYVDDFVILARSRATAEQELPRVTALLRERGLTLHPAKTRITDFDHGFDFLGRRFLKSFILDGNGEDSADEDAWDVALADAVPQLARTDGTPPPATMRQFRNKLLEPPAPLLSRPAPQEAVERIRPIAPRHRTLHLYGKNRRLDSRDHCFAVTEGGEEIWLGGADRVDRIDIGPLAQVSDDALRFALSSNTHIAFVDGRGAAQGDLRPVVAGRAALQLAQARHVIDPDLRLALARSFVSGKIANQRSVCQRWRNNSRKSLQEGNGSAARHSAIIEAVGLRIERMQHLRDCADHASSINELMGFEGEAAKISLQVLRQVLKGWTMGPRQRRPAPDAVNTLLNWLAHLLARDIDGAIRRSGLHSGFAHLHSVEDTRGSLAFDLMEELRAPLVEAQALTLVNTGELQPAHFYEKAEAQQAVWLTPEGSKRVIRHHERVLAECRLVHPDYPGKTGWRGVIEAQVNRLVRHYEGNSTYQPYLAKA